MKIERHINRNVTLTGVKTLNNPTLEERAEIKSKLTLENPEYTKAKKYSRWVTRIEPYLVYYSEDKNSITVPIGFDLTPYLETEDIVCYDKRVDKKVIYPPFVLTLRETQREAFRAYYGTAGAKMKPRNIVQLPTGKGKTILGLDIAFCLGQRTLIIVHKVDLLNGWKKDIEKAFDGKLKPFILRGTKDVRYGEQITIATIQTLNRLSERDLNMLLDKFGLIIQDEMHHCPASSYEVAKLFNSKYRLGLTATPERSDGLDSVMQMYYGDFAYRYKQTETEEDILPVSVISVKAPVYFDPICTKPKNRNTWIIQSVSDLKAPKDAKLDEKCQERISNLEYSKRPKVNYSVVDECVMQSKELQEDLVRRITVEHEQGHSIVVFFSQKQHIRLFYELLEPLFKGKVFTYYGDNSDKVNNEVLEKAEAVRDTITLTTFAKATEGTNVRRWEVEFLVSSISNGKNVEQALGRIRRVCEDKINPVRVYDYDYSDCYMLSNHTHKREQRYRKMGFGSSKTAKARGIFHRED